MRLTRLCFGLTAILGVLSCSHPERRFESVCQIVRMEAVEENAKGEPLLFDVELEWDPCPGDQYQVVRGGAAFAKCMQKFKRTDMVPVIVKQLWDSRGFYKWDIERIGDCDRPIDQSTVGSYEKSQECTPIQPHGFVSGFTCSRKPFRKLVAICPWMGRE